MQAAVLSSPAPRNLAIDTYRGLVMLLMMAEVLRLARVAEAFPGNWFWSFLAYHQTHVDWAGCSLHDTIQPGFSFLVGVALPYSIASRIAKGRGFRSVFAHALWRSLLLIALGLARPTMTNLSALLGSARSAVACNDVNCVARSRRVCSSASPS